jgi:hypothetical protein
MSERKPFHETIVEAINNVTDSPESNGIQSRSQMLLLAGLIKSTKIPKNHDAISLAWAQNCGMMGFNEDPWGVREYLLEQKREAEAEARAEQEKAAHEATRAFDKWEDQTEEGHGRHRP